MWVTTGADGAKILFSVEEPTRSELVNPCVSDSERSSAGGV